MKYLEQVRASRAALAAKRETLVRQMESITFDAQGEARADLTPAEDKQFRAAKSEIGRVDVELNEMDERIAELEAQEARTREVGRKILNVGGTTEGTARFGRPLGESRFADLPDARFEGDPSDALGEFLRCSVTRDWHGLSPEVRAVVDAEQRAQSEGIGSAGGYLVPTSISSQIWDLARPMMRTAEAGVQVVPFKTSEFLIPRQTADATPTWKAENDAIGEDALEFAVHRLNARTLSVLVKASRELVEDVPSLGDTVGQSFAKAFALEIDRVVLNGSGVGEEPLGIRNTSGIGSTSSVGSPLWADLITAAKAIRTLNERETAAILHTRDEATITTAVATDGHYVEAPAYVANMRRLESGQVPTNLGGGSESFILVGDFSQAVLGVRVALQVLPLVERFSDFGQVAWVGWARVDTAVMRTSAFHSLEGVTA